MRRIPRMALSMAALGLIASSCTSPGASEVAVVEMRGVQFQPAMLVVAPGTEVRWTNLDPQAHTVISGGPRQEGLPAVPAGAEDFDSGRLLEGESFARVLDVEGDYYYWCELHGERQMVGTIRVEEP